MSPAGRIRPRQLDLQALHRVRDRLVHRRTAVINQIRGFLLERGIAIAKGPSRLRTEMATIIEDAENKLTTRLRNLLTSIWREWKQLEMDIDRISKEIETVAGGEPACRRLLQIPGIGPLISTGTVAAIGNGNAFRKGRDFAVWLGLVPGQYSTGGKAKLLGISKRGNSYLRRMYIHGARSLLLRASRDTSELGVWIRQLSARLPSNKVAVALANKLARITWAVLNTGDNYRPRVAVGLI